MSDTYGLDPNETVIAGTGGLFVAPPGTAFPESVDDPIDLDDWAPLGLTEEDGVTLDINPTVKDFGSWQTSDPTRRKRKGVLKAIKAKLQQLNRTNILTTLGGEFVGSPGDWTYHPPADSDNTEEWAFLVEVVDGDRIDRIGFYRATTDASTSVTFNDDTMSALPLEATALAPAGFEDPDFPGRAWFWQSNSDAFDEPGGDT